MSLEADLTGLTFDCMILIVSSRFWSIPTFTLKFQHFDWSLPFLLKFQNFDRFEDKHSISTFWSIPNFFCPQISIFWSIRYFQSSLNILIDFHFCSKISTFDQSPLSRSNFNILIDSHICTQISTFWLIIAFSLKFQHFNSPLSLKFDILINLDPLFNQISTFWSTWHLHSNFNILINSHLIELKRQLLDWFPTFHSNIDILIDLTMSTQISTFWLIPSFVLKFQYSDPFLIFQSNSNILIDSCFCNKISTFALAYAGFHPNRVLQGAEWWN